MTSAKKQNVAALPPAGLVIDETLLALLACPACQGKVQFKDHQIVCLSCQRSYPVVNGIPVLLAE